MTDKNFISHFFDDTDDPGVNQSIKEIGALKNSQPPKRPTFIINQTAVKNKLIQKFADCFNGKGFQHIIISAKVGGGKTHFLNWIESRMVDNQNFYMVKFQTQETNSYKYNFIKKIVVSIFQKYFEEFKMAFEIVTNLLQFDENDEELAVLSSISLEHECSTDLAKLLYNYKQGIEKSAILRILGASHGKTEINRLKIKELSDKDYLNVIRLFVAHKKRSGYLLVLLDEFEHTYLQMTPAARRNFFMSYKLFIDEVPKFDPAALILITSVTEQSAGLLKNMVQKEENALWSRMENQIVSLQEFRPSESSEFNHLYTLLSKRFNNAYNWTTNIEIREIRKRFFSIIGESSQAISYRNAILVMLQIMDEARDSQDNNKEYNSNENVIGIDNIMQKFIKNWTEAHHNSRPGMLKTSLEALLQHLGYSKIDLQDERASVLYVEKDDHKKLFYISAVNNSKALSNNFEKSIVYKDKLSETQKDFETIFIYPSQLNTGAIEHLFSLYPDILPMGLNENEIFNLLSFQELFKFYPESNNIKELEDIINQLGNIKKGGKI